MATIKRLLPANCLCGPHDLLPGLIDGRLPRYATVLLSTAADSREIQLLPATQLYINACAIKVPAGLEARLVDSQYEACLSSDEIAALLMPSAATTEREFEITVYEARLRVGCHNQWTLVNGAKLKNSIVLDSERELLRCNGIPIVDSVFVSPEMGVVFQLEYSLRVHRKGKEDETVAVVVGEFLCVPRFDPDSGQFLPVAVSDPMITDSDRSITGTLIWTAPAIQRSKDDHDILLMCEVSPFQGSVHGASTDNILATIDERKHIEDEHRRQLKEMQDREKARTVELDERERELDRKAHRINALAQRNRSMKLSEEASGSISQTPASSFIQPGGYYPTSGRSPYRSPARTPPKTPKDSLLYQQQMRPGFVPPPQPKAEIIRTGAEQKPPEKTVTEGIVESMGREIPRGDQVFLQGANALPSGQSAPHPESVTIPPEAAGLQETLRACTIFLEFLSFQPRNKFSTEEELVPQKMAFSFQFFSFEPTRTEAARVAPTKDDRGEDVLALKLAGSVPNWTNRVTVHKDLDAMRLEFDFDPTTANGESGAEEEYNTFVTYLSQNVFKIWIWDAETQIPFGCCKMSLADLVRRSESMRTVRKDCDVLSLGETEEETIGRISLLLQNIGKKEGSATKAPVQQPGLGPSRAWKRGKTKIRSKPLTVKDLSKVPQMSRLIQGDFSSSAIKNEPLPEEERRKAELVYAYKQYQTGVKDNISPWTQESLAEDYAKYRTVSRAVALSGLVESTIPPSGAHSMVYTLGTPQLHPITFSNPYAKETAFSVTIYDPEARTDVQLVTSSAEWKQYCAKEALAEPPDWNMLTPEGRFLLRPGEQVVLVFRILGLSPPTRMRRNVTVSVLHDQTKSAEHAEEISLCFRGTHFDASFMFNEPERRSVDVWLPPETHVDAFRKVKTILCNDPVAEARMENSRIVLTLTTPPSPDDAELFVFLYSDSFFLERLCTLHAVVRSYHCLDINEVAGKRVIQSLAVEPDPAVHELQVFSGNRRMVRVLANEGKVVLAEAGSVGVPVSASTYRIGRNKVLLHGVDSDSKRVCSRWMFRMFAQVPSVSAEYEVQASAQENSQVSFSYQNATEAQKVYEVNSSAPAVARVEQPMLVLPPGERAAVRLQIAPPDREREAKVYVFVCDTATGRSEAFYFLINYGL